MKHITITELAEHRDKGAIPGLPLIVALAPIPDINMIRLKIDSTDLHPLFGLDIIVAHDGNRPERLVNLAAAIVKAEPDELLFWNVLDGRQVSIVSMGQKFIREVPSREELPCLKS
jgi:hypothetical protein